MFAGSPAIFASEYIFFRLKEMYGTFFGIFANIIVNTLSCYLFNYWPERRVGLLLLIDCQTSREKSVNRRVVLLNTI